MTVLFEAGTLIDCIQRAEKAAPAASAEAERYLGVIIHIQPENELAEIRTTNEIVYYRESIPINESDQTEYLWRLPSMMLARMLATFSSKSGDVIELRKDGGMIEICQGRKLARLSTIPTLNYPNWFMVNTDNIIYEVDDLGTKIKWVEWACDKEKAKLGLRLTSDGVYGTQGIVLARAPIALPSITKPVTIKPGSLTGMIPMRGTVGLGLLENQLVVTPNSRTQILVRLIDEKFPPLERAMGIQFDSEFRVGKEAFLSLARDGKTLIVKGETTLLRLFIGNSQLAGYSMVAGQADGIRDIIDVVGADHDMAEYFFNPAFMESALSNCPDDYVTMRYNLQFGVILIEGSSGYQCWVTPIDPKKAGVYG